MNDRGLYLILPEPAFASVADAEHGKITVADGIALLPARAALLAERTRRIFEADNRILVD